MALPTIEDIMNLGGDIEGIRFKVILISFERRDSEYFKHCSFDINYDVINNKDIISEDNTIGMTFGAYEKDYSKYYRPDIHYKFMNLWGTHLKINVVDGELKLGLNQQYFDLDLATGDKLEQFLIENINKELTMSSFIYNFNKVYCRDIVSDVFDWKTVHKKAIENRKNFNKKEK